MGRGALRLKFRLPARTSGSGRLLNSYVEAGAVTAADEA